MKNEICFLYFQYKENKMQVINNSFTSKPYYKQKETSQARYQEANIQTKMQAQPMKNMIINNITRKFNKNKVSYHSVSTQQLGQRPKKTHQPTKLTQQIPNSNSMPKKLMYVTVWEKHMYVRSL
jgi:hypothetical protein